MKEEKIKQLLEKFKAGVATEAEQKEIEILLETGAIDLADVELDTLTDQLMKMDYPSPSLSLDDKFYRMLAKEKKAKGSWWNNFFSWPQLAPQLALASLTLFVGLALGYFIRSSSTATDNSQIQLLSQQVTDLKEMMMLSLLEKESATERLRAVSLTQEMDQASQKVTLALLETLNNDSNVNVRLAALDALKPYVGDSSVRAELVKSIAKQESPLVQVALAELMAALQVKSSVKELEKIIQSERTPKDVKNRIKRSIEVII